LSGWISTRSIEFAVMDVAGKLLKQGRIENTLDKMREFSESIPAPGTSFFSALLIASEVGEIGRFEDSSSLVAHAGMAPSTQSSGGKTYHGPIMKSGSSYLRWITGQCARAHIRTEPGWTVANYYARIARKKGDQMAVVAASAKPLSIVYWALKEN
jgi:transposase